MPGTEYASAQRYRGMHGSFSPRDVHNTLIAAGPHFKVGFSDEWPTGNVDIAPTVAALLGLHFNAPDGRVLREALVGESPEYRVKTVTERRPWVQLPKVCHPDDPSCSRPGAGVRYSVALQQQVLVTEAGEYTYFDFARVARGSRFSPGP